MRFLELRRHSLRVRPNEHLSQEGVTFARRVGDEMGPFDLVVTSPSPRAFETAIAMGFAVNETYTPVDFNEFDWQKLARMLPEGTAFDLRSNRMGSDDLAAQYAQKLVRQWTQIVARLPEGGQALVISHGGYLDDSAVACLPDDNHREWGENFGHCEGVRLTYDREEFLYGNLIRLRQL